LLDELQRISKNFKNGWGKKKVGASGSKYSRKKKQRSKAKRKRDATQTKKTGKSVSPPNVKKEKGRCVKMLRGGGERGPGWRS